MSVNILRKLANNYWNLLRSIDVIVLIEEWICKTCENAVCRNKLPVQAKANGLDLGIIPIELKDLNTLELRLISLRIPL